MNTVGQETLASALEAFIRTNFQVSEDDEEFDRTVDLWDEGYVDSTGLVEVIAFLEEGFGVTVTEDMLFSPEFTSIDGMARLLADREAA